MRLSTRLTIAISLLLLALLSIHSVLTVGRQRYLFEQELTRDGLTLGRVLASALRQVWEKEGRPEALKLLERINADRAGPEIRWIPLDRRPDASQAPGLELDELERARLASGQGVTRVHALSGEIAEVYTYFPFRIPGAPAGLLEIRESLAERDAYIRQTLTWVLVGLLFFAALGSLLSHWLGRRFVAGPVRELIEQAKRVGGGDFELGPVLGDDELTELALAMNEMCRELQLTRERVQQETRARERTEAQLRHADRLATVGVLAAGLAHEIGTPLNVISGRAGLIEGCRDVEAAHRNAEIIRKETGRITQIIRRLLNFARRCPPETARVELAGLAGDVLDLVRDLPLARDVELDLEVPEEPLACEADTTQLEQVLTNLLTNALQASPSGGKVRVDVGRAPAEPPADTGLQPAEYLYLRVADEGEGMPPEVSERIFEPFYTTKDVGDGTGLGLSVSYTIVRDHGGWIDVESAPGAGSRFTVYLPRTEDR